MSSYNVRLMPRNMKEQIRQSTSTGKPRVPTTWRIHAETCSTMNNNGPIRGLIYRWIRITGSQSSNRLFYDRLPRWWLEFWNSSFFHERLLRYWRNHSTENSFWWVEDFEVAVCMHRNSKMAIFSRKYSVSFALLTSVRKRNSAGATHIALTVYDRISRRRSSTGCSFCSCLFVIPTSGTTIKKTATWQPWSFGEPPQHLSHFFLPVTFGLRHKIEITQWSASWPIYHRNEYYWKSAYYYIEQQGSEGANLQSLQTRYYMRPRPFLPKTRILTTR
jgi:hypothetical protein